MEKIHKIIITLLILAILFSIFSVIINLSISNISVLKYKADNKISKRGAGEINFYVEENNLGSEGR